MNPETSPGLRLRHIRENLGQSLLEVAQAIGCRVEYLEAIEDGKKQPSSRMWQVLGDHFMVDPDLFISGKVEFSSELLRQENSALFGAFLDSFMIVSFLLGMALVVLAFSSLSYLALAYLFL